MPLEKAAKKTEQKLSPAPIVFFTAYLQMIEQQ